MYLAFFRFLFVQDYYYKPLNLLIIRMISRRTIVFFFLFATFETVSDKAKWKSFTVLNSIAQLSTETYKLCILLLYRYYLLYSKRNKFLFIQTTLKCSESLKGFARYMIPKSNL